MSSKYRRLAESAKRALDDADAQHALIAITEQCIAAGLLRDGDRLRCIELYDETGSPSGRSHNRVVANMLDESVLNACTRSIIESDFELKNRWTDVFRKLEDGPGSAKKTMKYHFSIKDRARIKEYYRYQLYIVCKTWLHAAICRAIAPFVSELRQYRSFTYSGRSVVDNPEEVVRGMHKTSEPGAPFETWCKPDITGTSNYRSNKDRIKKLESNRSFYVVRYVGKTFPPNEPPDRELMIRMASTFPGSTPENMRDIAEKIVEVVLARVPRTQWLALFDDCEFYWGHGKVLSFPVSLGRSIPADPRAVFSPRPAAEPAPPPAPIPAGYVYDRATAVSLIGSMDLLLEIMSVCRLGDIKGSPKDRTRIRKTLFTPDIINVRTEAEARGLLQRISDIPLAPEKKLKRLLNKYVALATSDVVQWRFFVRLVQACKLPASVTVESIYGR